MDRLHTRTSDCILFTLPLAFFTLPLAFGEMGEPRKDIPFAELHSVLPLQVVERRLGLSWLSWLSSLESGVFVRNCVDFLPYSVVTRQQSYRDIKIWVDLSMLSFGVATPADAGQCRACHA